MALRRPIGNTSKEEIAVLVVVVEYTAIGWTKRSGSAANAARMLLMYRGVSVRRPIINEK